MLRDGISSGALDDIFLGGSGSLGGSPGGVGLGGLNGKLMGSGVGTNPLAAIFAASNAGGIPSPAGIQQVCKIYRCLEDSKLFHSFSIKCIYLHSLQDAKFGNLWGKSPYLP